MKLNPLNFIDFYKSDHRRQYPEGTELVYSNFTPRSDRLYGATKFFDGKVVNVGVEGMCKWLLQEAFNEGFFCIPKEEAVQAYKRRMDNALGPDAIPVDHIEALHDLGYLPLQVKALPEGAKSPMKVPVMTVCNTIPEFYWLVNYLETVMSNSLWKLMTTATIASEYRAILEHYYEKTGAPKELIEIACHDFSARGMCGAIDASVSGMGHLLSFSGTDTVSAIDYAENYYGANSDEELVGCSVPATEHSVTCASIADLEEELGGKKEAEKVFLKRLITELYPTGIVSAVADSFDFWIVITEIAPELKEEILNRQPNALGLCKTVFRPDCYSDDTQILTQEGWMYFKDIDENTLVAQVDNGEYSFIKPEKIITQDYKGLMHHFQDHHGKVDLLVTPNHRMVLEQNGRERVEFAENLGKKGHHKQKMSRGAKARTHSGGMTPMERLKIAFQADGSFSTGVTSSIRFHFSKGRKIERMKTLLNECGLSYSIYDISSGGVEFNIKTDSVQFSKDFSWVSVSNLCGEWCVDFVDELSHWDSSIRSDNRLKFDTTNKDVIRVVELVALSAGYGVLITVKEDNRQQNFSDVYTAHIMRDNQIGGQSWTNSTVEYTGKVYCVKVPSGKVIVKRNRCTMVCGNSGDPVKILTGYKAVDIEPGVTDLDDVSEAEVVKWGGKYYDVSCVFSGKYNSDNEYTEAEVKGAVECLWDIFGGTETDKGYKMLNDKVGLIYGDSITRERAIAILDRLEKKGFAASNVVFGVGSYTYQYMTRDTLGFAMKATYGEVNGEPREIFKDPVTDSGTKKSAKGLMMVQRDDQGEYFMVDSVDPISETMGELETVFVNGEVVRETPFSEIRKRVRGEI